MRTGDIVLHQPSGEEWLVAWADHQSGYMAPCGWPTCQAKIAERSDTEVTLRTIRTISATIVDRGRVDEKFRAKFCDTFRDLSTDLVSGALR